MSHPIASSFTVGIIKLITYFFIRPAFAIISLGSPSWNIFWLRIGDKKKPSKHVVKGCTIQNESLDGVPCTMLIPEHIQNENKLLFLIHGGGYVSGPNAFHWPMLGRLCRQTGIKAVVVHYKLAPENPFPASLNDVLTAYDYYHSQYSEICLLGDSAGGGLALAATLHLKAIKAPLPSKVILLSPWLDITLSNPDIATMEKRDKVLARKGLVEIGVCYANGHDASDYRLSPINGDLSCLPPTLMFVGAAEIFVCDCRKLKEKADLAGSPLTYEEWPNMFHVWVAAPIPQAKKAMKIMVDYITSNIPEHGASL